jgi:hypothetical protein
LMFPMIVWMMLTEQIRLYRPETVRAGHSNRALTANCNSSRTHFQLCTAVRCLIFDVVMNIPFRTYLAYGRALDLSHNESMLFDTGPNGLSMNHYLPIDADASVAA